MYDMIKWLALILVLVAQPAAAVTCNILATKINTVGFGQVNVQRDTPVGATLATTVSTGYAQVQTLSDSGEVCPGNYAITYLSAIESPVSGVFKTNLDGVGIKVSGMPGNFTLPVYQNSGFYNLGYYIISLVKTGEMTSGVLTPGLIAQAWFGSPGNYFTQISLDATSRVSVLSCSLSSQVITFDLGTLSASEFSHAVGFSPQRTATQNIGLYCNPGANINIELKGTPNPDAAGEGSVLALTGQGGENTADGVGVQLLYNDIPLKMNNRMLLKQSPGGQEMFPVTARYYQTKTIVTAGEANATATLDITYQ